MQKKSTSKKSIIKKTTKTATAKKLSANKKTAKQQSNSQQAINKSALIDELWSKCGDMEQSLVYDAVNVLLEQIMQTLAEGGCVEVRRFGVFGLQHRNARTARNPRTGEQVWVDAIAIPRFKAGSGLRAAINDE